MPSVAERALTVLCVFDFMINHTMSSGGDVRLPAAVHR